MKMLSKKSAKIISGALAISLLAGATGMVVYAKTLDGRIVSTNVSDIAKEVSDTSVTASKDETVYVLANADGSVKKIIVSDWLKNEDGASKVEDKSDLDDVKNVKGDESYTMNPDNMKVWDSNGEDIYYQGTTTKTLPVNISIKYKLDGKDISAEDLAGKSGKVTMHFDYTNNQKETVTIDGKEEQVYVPFVMVTGMILDSSKFSNVQVTNGKVIGDGSKCVVMGYALPGLQESLDISKDKFEIPSSVEITADVKDFSLATTMTLAMNDIFNNVNLDNASDLDTLKSSLDDLSTAANKLVDGSSVLYDGMNTLLSKSGELISGVDKLSSGADSLNSGANTVSNGTKELKDGIDQLNSGLNELVSNNDKLNGGAEQVFNTLLSTADSELAKAGLQVPKLTIDNYGTVLNNVLANLDKDKVHELAYNTALEKVTEAVRAQESTVTAGVTAVVRDNVLEQVLTGIGKTMSASDYKAAVEAGLIAEAEQQQINAVVDANMAKEETQAIIKQNTEAKIQSLINENMQSEDVQAQIATAEAQAAAGSSSIQTLKTQLDSYKEFYTGLQDYTAGVAAAQQGSSKLSIGVNKLWDGTKALADGTSTLKSGIATLNNGSGALIDGVRQLTDGSKELMDGMSQFNEEGIEKLVDVYGDVNGLINRMKGILDASKKYNNYSGISDGTEGRVKFIYKTDGIEEK